jgi:effector-binding domain-containing protein
MSHKGSFDAVPNVITSLTKAMANDTRLLAGPIMIIYYSDPQEVAEKDLLWEVWIPVANPGTFGKAGLNKMSFKYLDAMFVAYTYHIGPFETAGKTYEMLFDWAARNQYEVVGPPLEVYWSDPAVTAAEKLVTEIWLPVEEKKIPGIVK